MLRIGPHDHGREITYEEFLAADYEEGYKYELIRGELYVSSKPNPPHAWMEEYVRDQVLFYKLRHPGVVKRLSTNSRVFVAGIEKTTCPEPDLALYNDHVASQQQKRWDRVSPFIVVEVVSDSDPDKDYDRNVELYRDVPTILEYWLFDKVDEVDGPTLRVFRRDSGAQDWEIADYGPMAVYTTALLPEFSLPVRPVDE
jgi:Uma2 family endonuclease